MPFEEREKYIRQKLANKGINIETQDYVIKYVNLNQELFGNFINVDKAIERITDNLRYSISRFGVKNVISSFFGIMGDWSPYENRISQNPLLKLWSLVSKTGKNRCDSNIMHELDHCAITEYLDIDERQKEEYIQQYIERNKVTNIKSQQFIRNRIDKLLQRYNGILAVSGVMDYRQLMKNGIQTRNLNEGITAYKQEIYDEFLGNRPHTAYKVEKDVAAFIAEIIGREELISRHFNNDYDGMRKLFNEKTGKDLNDLVKKLNKKSFIKSSFGFLSKGYVEKFSSEMHTYMESFREEQIKKSRGRNTDFVPKCEIDHSKAIKGMEEHGINRQQDIEQQAI